ncbi:tRNA cytosine38-C5-methyltransferase [Hondaea fermentalgiana]|uniref:tRNA cytosine38-C5-methyltransferase n=1 Tax=Hondaea fermentalgiana TaxID=2315210 RepID=A0A2R5GML6_9STRA|nr:tRNA cytosine38-C5-methyltransferase [Hondaea fermentalgiana]|eukprot:GBG32126.1 tRNA cytosine38-C5-methyltransferase [Hondaea fermentalgiana]
MDEPPKGASPTAAAAEKTDSGASEHEAVSASPPSPPLRVVEFYSGIGGHHAALRLATTHGLGDSREGRKAFEVVRAFDMSEHAKKTYEAYWGEPAVNHRNILFLAPDRDAAAYAEVCSADLFVMSPPCQPYSRRKRSKHSSAKDRSGNEDRRAWSLHHLIDQMAADDKFAPRMLLLENVLGFENSASFERLTKMFDAHNFVWQALVLSPHMQGVPNSRPRLFVIAKRVPRNGAAFPNPLWDRQIVQEADADPERRRSQIEAAQTPVYWVEQGAIVKGLLAQGNVCDHGLVFTSGKVDAKEKPNASSTVEPNSCNETSKTLKSSRSSSDAGAAALGRFLAASDNVDKTEYLVDALTLWRAGNAFDVVTSASTRSHCFTKSYASFHGGAGSLLSSKALSDEEVDRAYETYYNERNALVEAAAPGKPDWSHVAADRGGCPALEPLGIRYFSPQEIACLLGFPADFAFPPDVSRKQQYALLGNSLSVHNVALLLRYMMAKEGKNATEN